MAIVEVRHLTKQFEGNATPAVDDLDLATTEGEYLVLLGPSGCGKTTLLRLIAGLEQPTSGEVLIGGQPMVGLPPRARKIAMVFQSYALYPHKTARRNIEFPLKASGMEPEERAEKVAWAAELLGITRLLDRRPRHLSGGERQRVALARALVREPDVFLLDEPLSNLDAKLRATARDDLKEFQDRIGTTTVYVTHDQVEAMGLGDRIAVMSEGRIRQLGTPAEVYHDPADTFVATFLGSPPMNIVRRDGVLVGFRPESLLPKGVVQPDDGAVTVAFAVHRVENLGSERHVHGTVTGLGEDTRVIAMLPSTVSAEVPVDETSEFVVRGADLRFFDRETGLRTERVRL
jgi:multiple sugar transport system ATP-binding protein